MRSLTWVSRQLGAVRVSPSWSAASLVPARGAAPDVMDDAAVERLGALSSLKVDSAASARQVSDMVQFCRQVAEVEEARRGAEAGESALPEAAMDVEALADAPPGAEQGFDALASAPRRDGQYFRMPKHDVLG